MHGILQIMEKALGWQKYEGNNWAVKSIRIVITFLLVNFAWVFFRMSNISDAFAMIGSMFNNLGTPNLSDYGASSLLMTAIALSILVFKDLRDEFFSNRFGFLNYKIVRWTIYVLLFCMVLNFGILDGGQFIYVNF